MNRFKIGGRILAVAALILGMSVAAQAQVLSNQASVALNATVAESIIVSTNVSSLSFTSANGATPQTIAVTTSWNLAATRQNVFVEAYFASSTALTGPVSIPTSAVIGQGIHAPSACTNTGTMGGVSIPNQCDIIAILGGVGSETGTNTSNFSISLPTLSTLPAGSYTGTLLISAAAN